jgi:2-methylcitrate dehydratase PrpD
MEAKANLTARLSAYITGEQAGQLPASIVTRAKTHILDTLGAMISGSALKPGQVAIDFVRAQAGPEQATVAGTNLRTSAILAALANAMTAHADETDDAHFPTVTTRLGDLAGCAGHRRNRAPFRQRTDRCGRSEATT